MRWPLQLCLIFLLALALDRACQGNEMGAPSAPPTAEASAEDAQGDEALAAARRLDRLARNADGTLRPLPPEEHMRRAAIYFANRAFDEAREHWQTLITRYPNDANVPAALFGIGRAFYQERRYGEALPFFERVGREYPHTREGRDGFYFVAPTLLRMGRAAEAALRYQAYIERFPDGERISDAYLNAIDTWREAGRIDEALRWIERTRQRFADAPTTQAALFAHLRLETARANWASAARLAETLARAPLTATMTNAAEISYLRAYSLERLGRTAEAARIYQSIADAPSSYYGWLATQRLERLGRDARRAAAVRDERVRREIKAAAANYPVPYRETILRAVQGRDLDPRLVLAIMRQESEFRPQARSRAAARGLMQLTMDAAKKYGPRVQLADVTETDLYRPEVSIRIAVAYLEELSKLFARSTEAVVASYNGGEDNVARWLERSGRHDPGIFTAEIGFAETKNYVFKVMTNYRAYCALYTTDLRPHTAPEKISAR